MKVRITLENKKLEELANEFFFTDSVKFGWNGRLEWG